MAHLCFQYGAKDIIMVYRKEALDLNINLKISVDKDTRAKRSTGLINQTLLDNGTSAVLSVSSILLHRRHQMHERLWSFCLRSRRGDRNHGAAE